MTRSNKTIIFMATIMSAVTQAALVLYTPAFYQISQALHITSVQVKSTLMSYLIGFGISQIIYGPISDRIGRKKPLLCGMLIFCLGCLWSVFASNYWDLFGSRFVQGLGIGACMTLSRTILRDCFSGKSYVSAASWLSSGFALGLGITPVIGGHLLDFFPWYSEFIFLLTLGVILMICFQVLLPETHKRQQGKLSMGRYIKEEISVFTRIFKDLAFSSYLIGGVLGYGVVIAYNTMAPFLLQQTMHYSASDYGWLTCIIAVGYYLGTSLNRALVNRMSTNKMMKIGLACIIISGFVMVTAAYCFNMFNIYVVFLPLWVATLGQALIWSNCIAGALKNLSDVAGSASAYFSCAQMLLSGALSGVLALPHEENQMPIALTVCALGLIAYAIFSLTVFRKK